MDLIVCSLEDLASRTLRDALLDAADLDRVDDGVHVGDDLALWTIDDLHLDHDDVDIQAEEALDRSVDRVVFLSRHQSQAGVPSLTVHPIGNFHDAPYGGLEETLVPAPVDLVAPMIRELSDRTPDRYEATLEATHHGPHLTTPTCFVEIGSDERAWKDRAAARAVVQALLQARRTTPDGPVVVGLGGGHYMPRLTDVARSYRVRLGHLLPDYHLDGPATEDQIDRLVEATPGVEAAYLDRRSFTDATAGTTETRLEDAGLVVLRSDDLDPVTA